MAAKRPFSLATRLTFFISLATIIAFFAFTWIMIHSVKAHFEERDVHDLRQLSTTLETVLDHADYPQARRLEIVKNIIAGYANVFICLDDGQGNILFQSPNGPDLSHMLSTPGCPPLHPSARLSGYTSWLWHMSLHLHYHSISHL